MDHYSDKLVDKINRQSKNGSFSYEPENGNSVMPVTRDAAEAVGRKIEGTLSEFGNKIGAQISDDVSASMREMNAMNAELITQYSRENQEGLLSATQEMIAAQASARDDMLTAISEGQQNTQARMIAAINQSQQESQAGMLAAINQSQQESQANLIAAITAQQDASRQSLIELLSSIPSQGNAASNEELIAAITQQQAAQKQELINAIMVQQSAYSEQLANLLSQNQENSKEQLADHMHKESVKVYRNVQAAMEDSISKNNTKLLESVEQLLATRPETTAGDSSLKKPVTIMMVLLGLGLIAQIVSLLWMFKII